MTPTELRTLGKQHGRGWQTRLAKGLGVNPRTVRRWLSGQITIREPMGKLIRQHFQKLSYRKRRRDEGGCNLDIQVVKINKKGSV